MTAVSPINLPIKPTIFHKIVLNWFDQHGRKALPWQKNKNPYRVWVSEIMLQQTQVSTVIPYFERFLDRFPDVMTLAQGSEDEVLHYWTGLGYYSRARNLHRAAQMICDTFEGNFPDTVIGLESLPGIGRSTAGAITAIAFQKRAAILDGNVKRVLARFLAIKEWPGEKKVHDNLWQIAEALTPLVRVADYTQAMMDLGATVCVRGKPQCQSCPLQKHCVAYAEGLEKSLPKKKPSLKLPIREVTLLLLTNKGKILLEKRPSSGIWGGLWSLPEVRNVNCEQELKTHCSQRFRYAIKSVRLGERFRHTFSHFHLDILPAYMAVTSKSVKVMEAEQQIWYNLQEPEAIGLPAPIKTLLMGLNDDSFS